MKVVISFVGQYCRCAKAGNEYIVHVKAMLALMISTAHHKKILKHSYFDFQAIQSLQRVVRSEPRVSGDDICIALQPMHTDTVAAVCTLSPLLQRVV